MDGGGCGAAEYLCPAVRSFVAVFYPLFSILVLERIILANYPSCFDRFACEGYRSTRL
jgi:hypothetical protein